MTTFTPGADFVANVKKAIQAIQPFRVDFIQQVFIDDGKELEEEGQLAFLNENCFKWEYRKPEHKIFLCTGERYQFYQPAENQATRGTIKDKQEQVLWKFLLSGQIPANARIDEKLRRISLQHTISGTAANFEISISPANLPAKVVQTDGSGYQTVYLFNNFQKNVRFAAGDFQLLLPKGTDIIDNDE